MVNAESASVNRKEEDHPNIPRAAFLHPGVILAQKHGVAPGQCTLTSMLSELIDNG